MVGLLVPGQSPEERETYENAVRVLTADVEDDASDAEAWFGLSIAYMHLGQPEAALDATSRAAALDPSDARFVDQLGEAYMALGRPEDAIDAFERAAAIAPRMFFPRLRLGELYVQTGRAVRAIAHLEEAVVLNGRDASARRFLGMAYRIDGQHERAVAEYERAIFLAPGEEFLYLEAADAFFSAGMEDEAESVLNRALERFPGSGQAHLGRARLHVEAGRLREALDDFQLALDSGQEIPFEVVYKTMGDIHSDLIEPEPALAYYDRALEANPESVDALLAKGDLYLNRNDVDAASAAYGQATALDPARPDGHHGLAETALRRGDLEAALVAAERVLELDPEFRPAAYVRGQALVRLGRLEEGRRQIESYQEAQTADIAEEQRARDIQAHNQEALALLDAGENAGAISTLRDAIALYPMEALLYRNLAVIQSRSGLHQDAADTYLEIIALGLGDALTHLRLAREYDRIGDADASRRHRAIYEERREAEAAGRGTD